MRTITPEREALIILSHLTEPSDATAGRLVREFGAEFTARIVHDKTAWNSDVQAFIDRARPRWNKTIVADTVAAMERSGLDMLIPSDPEWPTAQFEGLGIHAPLALWTKGNENALIGERPHRVSIVGARAATSYGEHVAMELTADLSRDHVIVSGAAYGIDGTAHRGAITSGGQTIAVLAGGVDRPYPAGHHGLLERIAASGVIVSELPPGSTPTKWRFLQRNRIIAALGDASIVVEAGWRSGSLNEAGHAHGMGRPLGAVPGPITSAASAGCHRLLREFDATVITSADDVRELTGARPER